MSAAALVAVDRFSEARGYARLIAYALAGHSDRETGWAWPSIRTLADENGIHPETVGAALARLEELGELHIEHGIGRRRNRYRLRLEGVPGSEPHEAPDVALVRGSDAHHPACLCADCLPVVRGSGGRSARLTRADPYRTAEPAESIAEDVAQPAPPWVPPPIETEYREAAAPGLEQARENFRRQTNAEFEAELIAEHEQRKRDRKAGP